MNTFKDRADLRISGICATLLLPMMGILFLCNKSILNLWLDGKVETTQNILAVLILAFVAFHRLSSPRHLLLPWLKANGILLGYFLVRLISFWQSGWDYSVLRTIFFEAFYLIGICSYSTQIRAKKAFYLYAFLYFEFFSTLICIAIFLIAPHVGESGRAVLERYTYYGEFPEAALFNNINFAGLMAGFALVLAIALYQRKIRHRKILLAFGVYNVFALFFFGSRTSVIGVICAVLALCAAHVFRSTRFLSKKPGQRLAALTFILAVLSLLSLYACFAYHENRETMSYTEIEDAFNRLSSDRYVIWKECYLTQQEKPLFGYGNLRCEEEARETMMAAVEPGSVPYYYYYSLDKGPHNGYIAMISATGWIGFLLFMALLLQRIRRTHHLENRKWYLLLVYVFAANLFESLFVLNRFFVTFALFLLLDGAEDAASEGREQTGDVCGRPLESAAALIEGGENHA